MSTIALYNDLNVIEMMARRYNGNILNAVKVLAQRNELLLNAPMAEANDVYTNVANRWKVLPKPTPRSINKGGNKGRGTQEQVRESIMLLDLQIEIDEALIDHEPDKAKAMMNEIAMHLEGTSQQIAYYLVYGNPGVDSRQPIGFALRRPTLGTNCVGLGGTGSDTTSLYVCEWDPSWFSLIYPRGAATPGFDLRYKDKQRVTDSDGAPYYAYCHQVVVELGSTLVDERALQRIANIESGGATNNFIDSVKVRELVKAVNRTPTAGTGNLFIYGNRTTKAQMDIYALEKANGFYMIDNITGRPITSFQGIPIRMVEQIVDTETAIS